MDYFWKRFYLFWGKGEGREKEGEKHRCGRDTSVPNWGPGLQPRHVPWLGIELETFRFAGWHSTHWAAPARAKRNGLFTQKTPWMDFKGLVLREIFQHQKFVHCMSPCIWYSGKDETVLLITDDWAPWVGAGDRSGRARRGFLGLTERSVSCSWWWLHKCIHVWKVTALYTHKKRKQFYCVLFLSKKWKTQSAWLGFFPKEQHKKTF